MYQRIPPKARCLYDNLNAGRVARRYLSIGHESRWPKGKRHRRDVQQIIRAGVEWIGWRDYGTRVAETLTDEKGNKDSSTTPYHPPSTEEVSPGASVQQLHNDHSITGSLNYLWRNEWSSRGRGTSWFSAWKAVEQGTEEYEGPIQQRSPLRPSEQMPSASSLEQEHTEAMRASLSFKKDLAALDAGLLHNPANGEINIIKEVIPMVPETNQQGDGQDTKKTSTNAPMNEQDAAILQATTGVEDVVFEPRAESMFQKYQRKFQGLLFQPWRPYTSINLDLDPEGEYVDPDMGHYASVESQSVVDEEQEVNLATEAPFENKTIHILGLGSQGKYVAHTLASLPYAPPITLLMHRPLVMQHWHDEGAAIRLVKNGEVHVQGGFNVESAAGFRREHPDQVFPHFGKNLEHSAEPPSTVIDTLIVTTDSWHTIPALAAIKDRLRQRSTICFVQDGLGIAEKVSAEIFTDPDRRPTYVLGRLSHRIASTDKHFTIIETQSGQLTCSKLPQRSLDKSGDIPIIRRDFSWSPQATHLVGTLFRAPDFNTKALGHKSFYKSQLENLVFGCVIGPLSVMYECTNDQLLYNYNASITMTELLKEISQVICSLPELDTLDGIDESFSVRKLQTICISAIAKTGKVESKYLQAVRAGKRTNIDYYNGWIVRRAAQLGIKCPVNEIILSMVKGKIAIKSKETSGYIPMLMN